MSNMQQFEESTFDQDVLQSASPVLVDFYADWCGPCKVIAPAIDELAAQYQGKALVAKLDTDRAPAISNRLGIRGIPTAIVFNRGAEVARQTGTVPKQVLEGLLSKAVA